MKNILILLVLAAFSISCKESSSKPESESPSFKVDYEKFELDNGLDVVFHVDRSDPVVAVALTAHVGSAREKEGRTGFAHLFEHLLFLESENLGKGGLDKMSARIGGSGANGSTSRDRTNYFQTVPKDALEKMLWAEADKLGWFINTVTEPVLSKEKQVVKNEKRQRVDNQPYGHTGYVIRKALYPKDHPYNWQVIGSLEDLQNATLADVKDFFTTWYVPNNVTLVVSGDFDTKQAKEWVKKYFDEIKAGDKMEAVQPRIPVLTETKNLYHEDNFARVAELNMTWPTIQQYQKDGYALDVLAQYLSQGKQAPFNQVLVEDKKLTSNVGMFQFSTELSGEFRIRIRAFSDVDLDEVVVGVEEAFQKFESEGISEKDLERIKAGLETSFYSGLSSVLGKGFQLAQYNIFANDPGFIDQDIKNILGVTQEDVMRVYEQYIKNKNYVATSFVPKGSIPLIVEGATKAAVVEEEIVIGAEESFDSSMAAEYEKTPSSFDRSVEPPYGESPETIIPEIWEETMANELRVFGIENREVPLVQFTIRIKGGQLLENKDTPGAANFVAQMMTRGTQSKTPQQLEEAIQQLGSRINVSANKTELVVSANTLAKNYNATLALVKEILLEPRWDATEFELVRADNKSRLQQQLANPNAIANLAYNKLLYGEGSNQAKNIIGTTASLDNMAIDDLKTYFQNNISPSVATFNVVGALSKAELLNSLESLSVEWIAKEVTIPEIAIAKAPEQSNVYFYDVPNAKQSVLNIGYPSMGVTDKDFYPATIMNYKLGGGGFASKLTQELREGKGYTYGIRSRFSESENNGAFTISSGVRSNVTLESTQAIKDIVGGFGSNFSEQDLETTKSFLTKSNARAFETFGAKLRLLTNISSYGLDYDYVKQREKMVSNMTVEEIKALANTYLNPDKMVWLIVGDKETQFERMKELGYGNPILLNEPEPLKQ